MRFYTTARLNESHAIKKCIKLYNSDVDKFEGVDRLHCKEINLMLLYYSSCDIPINKLQNGTTTFLVQISLLFTPPGLSARLILEYFTR